MEKIYMENNNKKKSFLQKLMGSNSSVILSFALAILAIGAVGTYGFTQISYALPENATSFTTGAEQKSLVGRGGSEPFNVEPYITSTGETVFCLERDTIYCDNEEFSLDTNAQDIDDYGLLYVLDNVYPNKEIVKATDAGIQGSTDAEKAANAKKANIWIAQSAIWSYLGSKGDPKNSQMTGAVRANLAVLSTIEEKVDDTNSTPVMTSSQALYARYKITDLLDEALNKQAPTESISINDSKSVSETEDGKYYQTELYTVTGSVAGSTDMSSYKSFNIKITGAPEGTIVVDADGKTIETLTGLPVSTKFYVRIPKDKVKEGKTEITIEVVGNFDRKFSKKFIKGECQKITTITNQLRQVTDGTTIEVAPAPDTGMSTSQKIYFIGLVVLLSGVGIIYANVKPAKQM